MRLNFTFKHCSDGELYVSVTCILITKEKVKKETEKIKESSGHEELKHKWSKKVSKAHGPCCPLRDRERKSGAEGRPCGLPGAPQEQAWKEGMPRVGRSLPGHRNEGHRAQNP